MSICPFITRSLNHKLYLSLWWLRSVHLKVVFYATWPWQYYVLGKSSTFAYGCHHTTRNQLEMVSKSFMYAANKSEKDNAFRLIRVQSVRQMTLSLIHGYKTLYDWLEVILHQLVWSFLISTIDHSGQALEFACSMLAVFSSTHLTRAVS